MFVPFTVFFQQYPITITTPGIRSRVILSLSMIESKVLSVNKVLTDEGGVTCSMKRAFHNFGWITHENIQLCFFLH